MPRSAITDVHTIAVTVADQDAALDFYVGVLGFEKRLDAPISPTMRWVEVAPRGARTSIALARSESGSATGKATPTDTGIRFAVPDAAAAHDELDGGGVEVGELVEWEGVPPMFTVDDPDGNRFYVVQAAS